MMEAQVFRMPHARSAASTARPFELPGGDVASYDTAERAVALALTQFGGLDIYVANAGLWDSHTLGREADTGRSRCGV